MKATHPQFHPCLYQVDMLYMDHRRLNKYLSNNEHIHHRFLNYFQLDNFHIHRLLNFDLLDNCYMTYFLTPWSIVQSDNIYTDYQPLVNIYPLDSSCTQNLMYFQLPNPDPLDNCYTMYFQCLKNIYLLGNPCIHYQQLPSISQRDNRYIIHQQMTPDLLNSSYIYHLSNFDLPGSLYMMYFQTLM